MFEYSIDVYAGKRETKEICAYLTQHQIDWSLYSVKDKPNDCRIKCEYDSITYPLDGALSMLSVYYHTARVFCTITHWDDREYKEFSREGGEDASIIIQCERFLRADGWIGQGVDHVVEIMPNGRLAFEGRNIFGECDVLRWRNIQSVSCGNWHTVGLTQDGDLLACGSNANGQCSLTLPESRAVQISCGRYHTAVLLENGKVAVTKGLKDALDEGNRLLPLDDHMKGFFPETVYLKPQSPDISVNDHIIESLRPGDPLVLRIGKRAVVAEADTMLIEIYTLSDIFLGAVERSIFGMANTDNSYLLGPKDIAPESSISLSKWYVSNHNRIFKTNFEEIRYPVELLKHYLDLFRAEVKEIIPESSMTLPIVNNLEGTAYEGRPEHISRVKVGDRVYVKANWENPYFFPVAMEVYTQNGETLGVLREQFNDGKYMIGNLAPYADRITAVVESVEAYTKKGTLRVRPNLSVKIQVEGAQSIPLKQNLAILIDLKENADMFLLEWENVVAIKSVYEAVFGLTKDGQLLSLGDCGCESKNLEKLKQEVRDGLRASVTNHRIKI